MNYEEFLSTKLKARIEGASVEYENKVPQAFDFQRAVATWALRKGRAAIFGGTGVGKTIIELDIASNLPGDICIAAPLSVALQSVRMAQELGVPDVSYAKTQSEVKTRITFINYDRIDNFDLSFFNGFLADESSILKALDGKTKQKIIERTANIPYRFSLSATPAPNSYEELGNQSEFLGIKTHKEMLAEFFVHDGGSTQDWRLKGHAKERYWEWLASWCIMFRLPSDLGFDDADFILPPLNIIPHFVESDFTQDSLIPTRMTLRERQKARQASVSPRAEECAKIIGDSKEQWMVWCDLNAEADAICDSVKGAEEIRGTMTVEEKEEKLDAFLTGKIRTVVSKPRIMGFGINAQCAHNMIFCGLSDSYEQFYQAVRRMWRYRQKHAVNVHIVLSHSESIVMENIQHKERDMETMQEEMVAYVAEINKRDLDGIDIERVEYRRDVTSGDNYTLHLGDCAEVLKEIETESIHYSIFSPPFASLYTYSDSERDMGNVLKHKDFFSHFDYAIAELYRVLKPGRLLTFHCMNTPTSKANDGYIGIRDFRGELIRAFQAKGFIYHSEVVIWKDPVTAMQRTKAIGLLHKQLKKDSALSRQGVPDYMVTMRKPGENTEPIVHTNENYPVSKWQNIASPVWMDINPSDTLQYMRARENDDERHICPLQLTPVRRCLELWTNPGDLVLSPFAGIGSEGYVSLELGRRFVGIELKYSYWKQATSNLNAIEATKMQGALFDYSERAAIATEPLLQDTTL